MTKEEIKSVSIRQYLETNGYNPVLVRKGEYYYLSPLRNENSPSFSVNPSKNLWNDFGEHKGGDLINLYQAMNPGTTYQEAKAALEIEIKKNGLKYSKDYEAEAKTEEEKQKWIASQKENNEKQIGRAHV